MKFPTIQQFVKYTTEEKAELLNEFSDWELTGEVSSDDTWASIRGDEDTYRYGATTPDLYATILNAYERTIKRDIDNNIPEKVKMRYATKQNKALLEFCKKQQEQIKVVEIAEAL